MACKYIEKIFLIDKILKLVFVQERSALLKSNEASQY
jgi:hypothetical protein